MRLVLFKSREGFLSTDDPAIYVRDRSVIKSHILPIAIEAREHKSLTHFLKAVGAKGKADYLNDLDGASFGLTSFMKSGHIEYFDTGSGIVMGCAGHDVGQISIQKSDNTVRMVLTPTASAVDLIQVFFSRYPGAIYKSQGLPYEECLSALAPIYELATRDDMLKAFVPTPINKKTGRIDYKKVPNGATIWITRDGHVIPITRFGNKFAVNRAIAKSAGYSVATLNKNKRELFCGILTIKKVL